MLSLCSPIDSPIELTLLRLCDFQSICRDYLPSRADICSFVLARSTYTCLLRQRTARAEKRNEFSIKTVGWRKLSDPRNRNHKSLAIGNHNFEVASFSRRNRSKIALSQSQKSHWAKKIAAIQNHTLVVATYSGESPDPCGGF